MDIVVTTNSPGEVAAWLTPFVRELRKLNSTARLTVFVTPCTFASGAEAAVVGQIPGVDLAVGPRDYVKYMVTGRQPKGFNPGKAGVVVFLGGDLTHAALLRKKLGYPAVVYNEGYVNWAGSFETIYLPDERARERAISQGYPPEKISVIGDLMLDAIVIERSVDDAARILGVHPKGFGKGEPVVSIFPGSRRSQLKVTSGLFSRSVDLIGREYPNAQFLLSVSNFVPACEFESAFAPHSRSIERLPNEGEEQSGLIMWRIETLEGTSIKACRGMQYDIMRVSDLALTLPGSNTAEMAFLGLPMIVAVPVDRPEEVPLEGIAGIIGSIPFVGRAVKRSAIRKYLARMPYTALPNRKAQSKIVPELVGKIRPEDVAIAAVDLLNQPARLEKMSEQLQEISGHPGAAERLAVEVLKLLESQNSDSGSGEEDWN